MLIHKQEHQRAESIYHAYSCGADGINWALFHSFMWRLHASKEQPSAYFPVSYWICPCSVTWLISHLYSIDIRHNWSHTPLYLGQWNPDQFKKIINFFQDWLETAYSKSIPSYIFLIVTKAYIITRCRRHCCCCFVTVRCWAGQHPQLQCAPKQGWWT